MPISSRNSGCWTCRARRKKCGEERPGCATCLSLDLPCHGYGPRPEWMDGSSREREKAQTFKSVVRRTMRIKQRQLADERQACDGESLAQEPKSDTINVGRRPVPSRAHTAIAPQQLAISPPCAGISMDQHMLSPISMPQSASSGSMDLISTEEDTRFGGSDDLFHFDSLCDIFEFSSPAPLSPRFEEEKSDLVMGAERRGDFETMFPPLPEANLEMRHDNVIEWANNPPAEEIVSDTDMIRTVNSSELSAIRLYLDSALPSIFPFATSDEMNGIRLQLQQLAKESKAAFSAILGPAMHWRQTQLHPYGLFQSEPREETAISYEQSALAWLHQMQLAYEMAGTVTYNEKSMELAQICVLQVLLRYVCTSTRTIQIVTDIVPRQTMQDGDWSPVMALVSNLTVDQFPDLCTRSGYAGSFSCALLAWIDLLGCTYTTRRPCLASKLKHLFTDKNNNFFPIQQVTGCQFDVVSVLSRIVFLKSWKEEGQRQGTLSFTELVTSGQKLEQELNEIIEANTRRLSNSADLSPAEECLWIVSNIYASAACVYLHTVLSGQYPEVSEIKSAVSATIESLKRLPSGRMLKTLAWPILISSSLASSEHWPFFEKLEQGLTNDFTGNKRVLQALSMSKECYRVRNRAGSETVDCSWQSVLKTMANVPLIF